MILINRFIKKDTNKLILREKRKLKNFSLLLIVITIMGTSINVFAEDDPITVIDNLSNFINELVKGIGFILLLFSIVQIGLSIKNQDPSQRANGFFTFAGGVIITFSKKILDLITGS